MARTCIIVADGARARFITLEVPLDPELEGGARLREHRDLVNPIADIPERHQFSDRRGLAHASPRGAAHALDDHRDAHHAELERRYAQRLGEDARQFVAAERATRLLIVAEPRLLGELREHIDGTLSEKVEIVELGENLSRHPLNQIQEILALRGPCQRRGRRSRGSSALAASTRRRVESRAKRAGSECRFGATVALSSSGGHTATRRPPPPAT
jgi:protein required for attachment to host cells